MALKILVDLLAGRLGSHDCPSKGVAWCCLRCIVFQHVRKKHTGSPFTMTFSAVPRQQSLLTKATIDPSWTAAVLVIALLFKEVRKLLGCHSLPESCGQ